MPRVLRQKQQAAPLIGSGVVKAVTSGDTLLIFGSTSSPDKVPMEKEITISGIRCPRYARGRKATDEPWGWHAREFLRKRIVGRVVQFNRVYKHTSSGGRDGAGGYRPREYCKVSCNGQDLARIMVLNGWAKVSGTGEEVAGLKELEKRAEEQGLGIHDKRVNPDDMVRMVDWYMKPDVVYQQHAGRPFQAIVDRVIDGSQLRFELMGEDLGHRMITVNLSGASCPGTPIPGKGGKGKKKAQPWALEAVQYVEERLLHRDAQVLIQGVDKYGNLFGTVRIKSGDIAAKLLENGYAKYVKWSGTLTGYGDRLRNLEDGAKMQRLRLWSNYDPEKDESKDMPPTPIMGTVCSILSGDRFEIKVMGAEKPQRINLASIRAPRMPNRSNPVPEPLAMQSREFLRSLFAKEKKVKCIVDYTRTVGKRDADLYATVYCGSTCINEAMLAHGYAEALRHNKEEDRSGIYSRLLVTEQAAQKANKGVHNPSLEAKPFRDFTQPSAKDENGKSAAAKFAEELKGAQPGIVEYVFSSTKYKVYLPRQNAMIICSLIAVRSPDRKVNTEEGQTVNPLHTHALDYARNKVSGNAVKVALHSTDRNDAFLATVLVGKEDIGVSLLKQGLGSVFRNSAENAPSKAALLGAEKAAKEAKRGLWENYVPRPPRGAGGDRRGGRGGDRGGRGGDRRGGGRGRRDAREEEEEEEENTTGSFRAGKTYTVRLSELNDGATAFAQVVDDKDDRLAEITASLRTFKAKKPDDWTPKRGQVVAGLYTAEDTWCRVKLESNMGGKWQALFVDFGNVESLDSKHLAPLPEDLAKSPPCATQIYLSCTLAPKPHTDYFNGAGEAFSHLAWDRDLKCRVDFIDYGKVNVTLWNEDGEQSINEQLVMNGFIKLQGGGHPERETVRCPRSLSNTKHGQEFWDKLQECRKIAYSAKRFVWEYGYISEDEDDNDKGRVPNIRREAEKLALAEAARKAKLAKNKASKQT